MPITGSHARVTLTYEFLGQKCQTQRDYELAGAAFLTATAAGVAEAWWNDVKTAWRATVPNDALATFQSVRVEEFGGGFGFGEYAIPLAEQKGTRSPTGLGEFLPAYVAVGCRLVVATRVTRPGQVGFPFVMEGDNANGTLQATLLGLLNTLAAKYSAAVALGAPVATGTMHPSVIKNPDFNTSPAVHQRITGHIVNTSLRHRNTRTPGRGQ